MPIPLLPSIHILITIDGRQLAQALSKGWESLKRSLSLTAQVDKTEAEMERALECVHEQIVEDIVNREEIAELLDELAQLGERAAKSAKGHSAHNPIRIAKIVHTRHDMKELESEIKMAGTVQKMRRNAEVCRLEAKHLASEAGSSTSSLTRKDVTENHCSLLNH